MSDNKIEIKITNVVSDFRVDVHWGVIPDPQFKWIAVSHAGMIYAYEKEPILSKFDAPETYNDSLFWHQDGNEWFLGKTVIPKGVDWRELKWSI